MAKKQPDAEYCKECCYSGVNYRNEAVCENKQDDKGSYKVLPLGTTIPSWCRLEDADAPR